MINTNNIPRAYSEVYAFMNAIGEEYIKKVPTRVYDNIKNYRDKNYNPVYKKDQTMTQDMISKEALALIAGLNLQYWCNDEDEKKRLKQCYINNQIKEEEKYSYENLFRKQEKDDSVEEIRREQTALAQYEKESIFLKLINKIKDWWNKII